MMTDWLFPQLGTEYVATTLLRLLVAALCGGLIGIERGRRNRPAGLRTHMLVCIGSALVMLTNQQIAADGGGDPTRLAAQVISGVGFLGAGTILIDSQNKVRGLTTAAGLWVCACIGIAVGAGYYVGALTACGLILLTFGKFAQVEERFKHKSRMMEIFAEFEDAAALNAFLVELSARQYQVLSFETADPGKREDKGEEKKGVAANVTMWVPAHKDHEDILLELEHCPGLRMIEEL